MGGYVTANTIKELREAKGLTQRALAERLGVTDKAVSRWESARGLPDISLLEDLAAELGVSIAELFTGDVRVNTNRAGNVARLKFYVCPVCGNVVCALGEGSFSCCGVHLLPQEPEDAAADAAHAARIERVEDDWYVTLDHPMTKRHYISFVAYVTTSGVTLQKFYPEQEASARFPMRGSGTIYFYCNRHGLFRIPTPRIRRRAH